MLKKYLSSFIIILLTVITQHRVLSQCNSAFTYSINQNVVTFTSGSNTNGVYHYWIYGDGTGGYGPATITHTYTQTGVYTVGQYVQDSLISCVDSSFQTLTISVVPQTCQASFYVIPDTTAYAYYNYMYSFFANPPIPYSLIQSLSWTLDGVYIGSYNGISEKLYPGTHQVCLTIVTTTGCTSSTCQSITTRPLCNRTISFTSVASQTSPNIVTFTPSPNQANLHYNWDFGDWTFSNQRIPTHTYTTGGTFSVKLVVHDSSYSCLDTIRQNVTVAPPPPPPNMNCTASYTYVLNNQGEATFTATSNQNIVSQLWHIYNYTDSTLNTTLTTSNPVYAFVDTGYYQVCVQLTTDSGCVTSYCDWIYVNHVGARGRMYVQSYPNPATGSNIQLNMVADRAATIHYTIYDLSGNAIYQGQRAGTTGSNIITIPVLQLKRGQYFIDITCGDQRKRSIFQKL